jgi:hypothetical protein
MRLRASKVHRLTLGLMDCTARSIVDEGKCMTTNSGDALQKGMAKLARCGLPHDVLLLSDDHQVLTFLLDHRLELGVTGNGGGS